MAGRPRLLPSREEVVRLYVEEEFSLWNIARKYGLKTHKAVEAQLKRAGIPRRAVSIIAAKACKVNGCTQPAKKIFHKRLGVWYGTLCEEHRDAHYRKLNREINQKARAIPVEKQEPWRWIENQSEEMKWIHYNRKSLRAVRRVLTQITPREASSSQQQEFQPDANSGTSCRHL